MRLTIKRPYERKSLSMIFLIATFLANLFGFDFEKARKYASLVLIGIVLIVIAIPSIFIFRACNRPPKLDEKQIQKVQKAIAAEDRKEMIKILAESDVREAGIDDSIKAVEQATEDATKNYNGKSNEDLAAELNRRANQ